MIINKNITIKYNLRDNLWSKKKKFKYLHGVFIIEYYLLIGKMSDISSDISDMLNVSDISDILDVWDISGIMDVSDIMVDESGISDISEILRISDVLGVSWLLGVLGAVVRSRLNGLPWNIKTL